MKSSVLPAEITSVEDKITANLSLKQLILMVVPVVLSGFIFFVAPPINKMSLYKFLISFLLFLIFLTLAIRLNNKIILEWLIITGKFYIRPKIYVFSKDIEYAPIAHKTNKQENLKADSSIPERLDMVNPADISKAQFLIVNSDVKISFNTKKEKLNASLIKT